MYHVYFICAIQSGHIKIGRCSGEPIERLRALQVGNSNDLFLIGSIPYQTWEDTVKWERESHHFFEAFRIRGEWFRPDPDLLRYIRQAATGPDKEYALQHLFDRDWEKLNGGGRNAQG